MILYFGNLEREILYFGNLEREPGHYLWSPNGVRVYDHPVWGPGYGDGFSLDGGFAPQDIDEVEGLAQETHMHGWTVISFWDRSGDARGGCSSSFLMEGAHDFETVVDAAKVAFPNLWARFGFEVKLVAYVDVEGT